MCSKRIAVVTDTVSPEFYLPTFVKHYKSQIKDSDLFIIVPQGFIDRFAAINDVNIVEMAENCYDDNARLRFINEFITTILETHDWVVRVDCDEILVADPRRYYNLDDFITRLDVDYATAIGHDVIASPSDEQLDFARPILGVQRNWAFALTNMNKTAITRRPLRWGRGFHTCNHIPQIQPLFLFHLKRADIDLQYKFGCYLAELIRDDKFIQDYYLTPIQNIRQFHADLFKRAPMTGWENFEDKSYLDNFIKSLRLSSETGLWDFDTDISQKLVEIPVEFSGIC